MINIITGSVNSGKTTKLINIYNSLGKGDGFFGRKIYKDGHYSGQEIVQVSSGESKIWSLRGKTLDGWHQEYCCGAYSFSKDGLQFADHIIKSLLQSDIEPIFIDEIGPLELQDKGFHSLFKNCVASNKELYVVVRKDCVKDVLDKYHVEQYNIYF